jgi:hypothetical protein
MQRSLLLCRDLGLHCTALHPRRKPLKLTDWLYLDLRMLLQEREVTISLVAIVAPRFMYSCHPGRYFGSKQIPQSG